MPNCVASVWLVTEIGTNLGYGNSKRRAIRRNVIRVAMETANVGQFRGEQHVRVCRSCESGNHRKFNAELAIHFPGLKCLNKPIVWVFPMLLSCLDYGFTEFAIPRPSYNSYGKARTTEGMRQ